MPLLTRLMIRLRLLNSWKKQLQESIFDDFEPLDDRYEYTPSIKQFKLDKRDVSKELDDEQYQARLDELNNNAENKHYVLFFDRQRPEKLGLLVLSCTI